MKQALSIARAKARFAECVRRAEAGEHLVLTRHGRPVARLVPIGGRFDAAAGELREPEGSYQAIPPQGMARPATESRREALERLLQESVWPRVPESQLGTAPDKREREEILGYGSDGV